MLNASIDGGFWCNLWQQVGCRSGGGADRSEGCSGVSPLRDSGFLECRSTVSIRKLSSLAYLVCITFEVRLLVSSQWHHLTGLDARAKKSWWDRLKPPPLCLISNAVWFFMLARTNLRGCEYLQGFDVLIEFVGLCLGSKGSLVEYKMFLGMIMNMGLSMICLMRRLRPASFQLNG